MLASDSHEKIETKMKQVRELTIAY